MRLGSLFIFKSLKKKNGSSGRVGGLTGGDWQRPVMLLGDLKILVFLFASQLPRRKILPSPAVSMHAPVCIGLGAGSLTPDFHLHKIF